MLPLAYREAELPQLLPVQYQAFVSIRLCRIVVNLCHSECLKRLSKVALQMDFRSAAWLQAPLLAIQSLMALETALLHRMTLPQQFHEMPV